MQRESLEGVVERITYYSDETGYTVLQLRPNHPTRDDLLLTVVGVLPEVQPGESVRVTGLWTTHSEYGKQFRAESIQQMAPATLEGLERYLGSGLIKGVRERTAQKIVKHFGMYTMEILDQNPDRLFEVPGVGRHKATLIINAWAEQKKIKEVMLFLQSHRVSTALAVKIYKHYGDNAIAQVQADPYQLARDVYGIGFKTADQIARNMGLPTDSPQRIAAGVVYALQELNDDGHVYAPRAVTVEMAAQLLEVPAEACDSAVDQLVRTGQIMVEELPADPCDESVGAGFKPAPTNSPATATENIEALYLPSMFYSEKGAARRVLNMVTTPASRLWMAQKIDWAAFFARLSREDQVNLTDQQQEAVRAAFSHKVSILTGGPGTGKTTTLRAVIRALESVNAKYALASPTGRAAKRLSEATGRPAKTIHRLLGYSPREGFGFNEDNPLDVDMLIVDEVSMLDLVLSYNLLKALAPETHLMLVGDVDQLPSVGAGDVLRDLIRSGKPHVTRLAVIFRQAGGSLIISNAHKVNQGAMPDLSNQGNDFFLFGAEEPDEVADLVVDVVQNRIPRKFGLHPLDDVQVLAPMYRGKAGVQVLNERLQEALNPPGRMAERRIGGRTFRVGDKVMQTRNNYDKDVYNGDIGRIYSINFEEQTMQIMVDGRLVTYDWGDADELLHAFAASVHRSQGTEYPAVVIPLVTQHYMMLQRNLLYTAITRAKRLVVLVGSRKAIGIAVKNDKVARRYSGLCWRLTNLL